MEIGQYIKKELGQNHTPPADGWAKIASDRRLIKFNRWQKIKVYLIGTAIAVVITATTLITLLNTNKTIKDGDSLIVQQNTTKNVVSSAPTSNFSSDSSESTPISLSKEKETRIEVVIENRETQSSVSSSTNLVSQKDIESPITEPKVVQKRIVETEPVKIASAQPAQQPVKRKIETVVVEPTQQNTEEEYVQPEEEPLFEEIPEERKVLFIPNAFTPDGDGLNDIFLAQSLEEIIDFEMIISDRRGSILFRSKDIQIGWNGEYRGNIMPQGTYIYVIIYRTTDGERQMKKGSINLIK